MTVGRRATDALATVGSLLAVRWLMRHRPTGDCWQEPTKAVWLFCNFFKKGNNFNGLLAWHSRGRGFDSLQLHHEACQGVTEKSVTPFSLAPCQRAPTQGFGGYVSGQNHLPAHLLDQETIRRSLEFFSRGRPPPPSFSLLPKIFSNFTYSYTSKKTTAACGIFKRSPPPPPFWTFGHLDFSGASSEKFLTPFCC